MNPATSPVRSRSDVPVLVVRNETEVYEAPMMLVMAAAHSTIPNRRRPTCPAACSKADAAWLAGSSTAPPVTTPRIARKSTRRMIPVMTMPTTEPRVISRR